MKTIEKWLLRMVDGKLSIIPKQVSKFAPINRLLDEAGFYMFDFKNVNGVDYICVYEPIEEYTKKSKILVTKDDGGTQVDLDDSDVANMDELAKHYLI